MLHVSVAEAEHVGWHVEHGQDGQPQIQPQTHGEISVGELETAVRWDGLEERRRAGLCLAEELSQVVVLVQHGGLESLGLDRGAAVHELTLEALHIGELEQLGWVAWHGAEHERRGAMDARGSRCGDGTGPCGICNELACRVDAHLQIASQAVSSRSLLWLLMLWQLWRSWIVRWTPGLQEWVIVGQIEPPALDDGTERCKVGLLRCGMERRQTETAVVEREADLYPGRRRQLIGCHLQQR